MIRVRRQRLGLACVGLFAFHLAYSFSWPAQGLWIPTLGIGLALLAWLGFRILPYLAADLLLIHVFLYVLTPEDLLQHVLSPTLALAVMGSSWWVYREQAKAAIALDDPKSAVLFLIMVPGVTAGFAGLIHAACLMIVGDGSVAWGAQAGMLWISRALGLLMTAPLLLVVVTPWLVRHGIVPKDPYSINPGGEEGNDWTWGELIETGGLTLGNTVFTLVMVLSQLNQGEPQWPQWGVSMLLVIWASLRQGLRGGIIAASVGSIVAIIFAMSQGVQPSALSPFQGNLFIQCSAALLVGASSSWIHASEARYRLVVGHIPVVLYSVRLPRPLPLRPSTTKASSFMEETPAQDVVLAQAVVTLVSPACKQVLGRTPESLMGPIRVWLNQVDPADRELLQAAIAQLRLQKQPVTCEYRIFEAELHPPQDPGLTPGPAGSASARRWVRSTLAPNYTAEGALAGWEGVVEDITEQRSLSQTMRRLSNMLQALVTNLPTGVFFVQGPTGRPILVNARARQLLGRSEDPSAGIAHLTQTYRLQRPDGTPYPTDELPVSRALFQGKSSMANDIVIRHANGRTIPLITWAAPIDLAGNGEPDAAVWVLEDLTPVQQAESARRETASLRLDKERYQKLVDTLPLMVLQFDLEGNITLLNTAVEKTTGFSRQELLEPGFWVGLIRPEEREQFRIALSRTLEDYQTRLEFRFRAHEGPLKSGHGILQPTRQGNTIVGSTAVIVDMTFQRRLEEELRNAQRLELVGRLAGGTVHDFNNLLTVMIGLSCQAMTTISTEHPAGALLERVIEAGEQASHLAGQILTFGRERRQPGDVRSDLNSVVLHSLRLLKGVLPGKIEVATMLPEEPVEVRGEENQLKQVIMNLCLNARDAMPQGGTLTVQVERVATPDAAVPAPAVGSQWVKMTVADTGTGMGEETRARIFEPFFSTKERGTGLGLAVVRQITESFNGFTRVHSQPDQGTQIEVWLQSSPPGD